MKEVIDQAAYCRKALKMAGARANGRCVHLDGHGEARDSARLIDVVTNAIDDCIKCQRKGSSEIHGDSHHTIHVVKKTRRMLEAKLASLEAETEPGAASTEGLIIPPSAMSAQTADSA